MAEERVKEIKLTPLYYDYVLNNDYDAVVQVGGRFSGKSHNEQIRLVGNLGSKPDYKLLVIEDLQTGMSEGFHSGLYDRIYDFEHDPAYTPKTKVAHIRNTINGNVALFRGYNSEQQKLNVKKMAGITEIVVEEGEWMTFDDFISLYQQLRGGKEEDRKLTILLNPVNPECFVNSELIETEPDKVLEYFPGTDRPKVFENSIKTKFELDGEEVEQNIKILVVLSTHFDNNYLTLEQRASIEQYRETDPEAYQQLGEARFIRPSGTYFKEFDRNIHVVKPFDIPRNWTKYVTMDYGLDMFAAYFIALDPENNGYVYKEIYESDLVISEACKRLHDMTWEEIDNYYAPPDLWNRRQETGKSAADIFRDNDILLRKTDNNRVQGWYAVKEWLKPFKSRDPHTGKEIVTARLKIFSNCTNLIRTLPQLQRDEKKYNDVATEPHELTHAPDAIRGFCVTKAIPGDHKTYEPKGFEDDEDCFAMNRSEEGWM